MRGFKAIAFFLLLCGALSGTNVESALIPEPQIQIQILNQDQEHNQQPINLALRFVELLHQDGSLMMSEGAARGLTKKVNKIFSACQIQFSLEDYQVVKPQDVGLSNYPKSLTQMTNFRKPFFDPRYLVIIKTGKWDHNKVGNANAWTAMPGDAPSGVVIESPVSSFAGLVAHELGHYLDLYHVENSKNLMNAMIYGDSKQLSQKQCLTMRSTAMKVWASALRDESKQVASINRLN